MAGSALGFTEYTNTAAQFHKTNSVYLDVNGNHYGADKLTILS